MGFEPLWFLGCCPSSPNQAIDIASGHCERVIDGKDWIKAPLLHLPVPRAPGPAPLKLFVVRDGKVFFQTFGVTGAFVGFYYRCRTY